MKRRDVIAQAQSGTGKTATFSIALLQSIDTTVRETQVLCLSPTRELATQIQKVKANCSKVNSRLLKFGILQEFFENSLAVYFSDKIPTGKVSIIEK